MFQAVAGSPPLRGFNSCGTWGHGLVQAGPDPLRDLSQPELFYGFVMLCSPSGGKTCKKNQHPAILQPLGLAELGFVCIYHG